ncbi:uncharacterized protein LOC111908220 [Lactuca sativa]|uniref:Uncharacterized protein n=1 Tax=Lactuca sativa TaxID=4236 RepID=A0A9R1X813_LACSA|nr:uncharacterized protein LOC111908220 [Lactuca sativa]KAJ0200974.1 hypothetical protein LSAT_V11C600323190 [Lactuca sativa]
MLHTEPSFCIYADEDGCLQNEKRDLETKSSKKSDSSGEFSFAERSMGLIVEDEESNGFKNEEIQPPSPKMYLATGFGIDGIGGTEFTPTLFDDEYYKMIVDQDPYNPLALRKCAQFLQSRGDLTGAEDYFLRATLEDPNDGQTLMQYAKFVLEVHGDQDKALSYFEKAALVAHGDCNILAAYASFLWEIDEECEHGGAVSVGAEPVL